MTTDTVAMLDAFWIDQTDVVGWSDGGIVALELAMTHPERLGRVVAYGANSSPEGDYAEPQVSDQMPPFEDFVADYQRLSPEPERFDELFAALGDLWKVATDFTDEELESITVPVLILDGAQEEFNRIVLAFLAGEEIATPTA